MTFANGSFLRSLVLKQDAHRRHQSRRPQARPAPARDDEGEHGVAHSSLQGKFFHQSIVSFVPRKLTSLHPPLLQLFSEGYSVPPGETYAAILCGANMNFDRLRFVAERAELGEGREALLSVEIPEKPGRCVPCTRTAGGALSRCADAVEWRLISCRTVSWRCTT